RAVGRRQMAPGNLPQRQPGARGLERRNVSRIMRLHRRVRMADCCWRRHRLPGRSTMRMKFQALLAAGAAVLLATSALAGQAKPPAATPAAKPGAPTQTAPAAPAKFVPPIRGEAAVNMTKPVTKREKDEVVTTFKVKNPSATGSIAG